MQAAAAYFEPATAAGPTCGQGRAVRLTVNLHVREAQGNLSQALFFCYPSLRGVMRTTTGDQPLVLLNALRYWLRTIPDVN